MKKVFLLAVFLVVPITWANEEKLCSSINYCSIQKKTYEENSWKNEYTKELHFDSLCLHERPSVQLESALGLELWVFNGDKAATTWLESQPHVTANLYTSKLTYVVATGSAPINSTGFSFSHRLNPKGKTIVTVDCYRR